MKSYQINSLGYNVNVSVPDSIEEFDRLGKREGCALDEAIKNVLYRGVLAEFRGTFTEKLEELTKIERKTKPSGKVSKDEDGNETQRLVYDETEGDYIARVVAEISQRDGKSAEDVKSDFAGLAQEVAQAIAFDPSETEKKVSGPKKIAAKYLEIAKAAEAGGKLSQLAAKLSQLLNTTIEATVDAVARGIAEDQRRKAAALENQYV